MAEYTETQKQRMSDLLKEKSLWQVYKTSRKIRFSKFNNYFSIVFAVASAAFCLRSKSDAVLADQLLAFATTAFSFGIAQLGFLLAGFSFFATVADKEMFCRMAEKDHAQSGLSYVKYNFFVFMRVFVEYLVFSVVSLALMVILTKGIGIRESLSEALSSSPNAKHAIAASSLGLFVGGMMYLLLQLASFIFNIFHVVMTSIRWALQKDYEVQNEKRLLSSQPFNDALSTQVLPAAPVETESDGSEVRGG